jgi:hypothetical protein
MSGEPERKHPGKLKGILRESDHLPVSMTFTANSLDVVPDWL